MIETKKSHIDLALLRELMELMRENDVHELEYQMGEFHIRLSRGKDTHGETIPNWVMTLLQSRIQNQHTTIPAAEQTPSPVPTQSEEAPIQEPSPEKEETDEHLHIIRSPIVGTFYRAPSPDAPPYVEVGDSVKKGQTLCIVEAMKIMNEIQSDVDGEVVKIYVANAAPVEYGQELFAIRPAHES